jgi:Protein of unknown function (DUF3185)
MSTPASGPALNRTLFIVFFAVGVVALTLGVLASESIGSDFSRLFTGRPSNRAVWLLLGGTVTTVVGLVGLARGTR